MTENGSRSSFYFQSWSRAFGFIFIFLKEKIKDIASIPYAVFSLKVNYQFKIILILNLFKINSIGSFISSDYLDFSFNDILNHYFNFYFR